MKKSKHIKRTCNNGGISMKRALIVILLFIPLYLGGHANGDELKPLQEQINNLKKEQAIILKELQEIKKLLREGTPKRIPFKDKEAVIDIGDDPFMGDKNAVLTMIEFTDYECSYCARYFRETLPEIEKNYIKTGKIKYVLMDFPIERIHKNALKAHVASNCAAEQNKYWEAHDWLFKTNAKIPNDLTKLAETLGLNMQEFDACINSEKYPAEIRKDEVQGREAGVRGTPTFYFGLTTPNSSTVKVKESIRGAQPYANFVDVIEKLLQTKK